jgi:hypothetical protein
MAGINIFPDQTNVNGAETDGFTRLRPDGSPPAVREKIKNHIGQRRPNR